MELVYLCALSDTLLINNTQWLEISSNDLSWVHLAMSSEYGRGFHHAFLPFLAPLASVPPQARCLWE